MAKKPKTKGRKKLIATKGKSVQNKKKSRKIASKAKKKVLAIPKDYHSVTPCLTLKQASDAIDFYKRAFAAKEIVRFEQPDGKIVYAEIRIGNAKIMLNDERPDMDAHSPEKFGGSPASIHLYVKNVDKTVDNAVSAGAKIIRDIENMFYGDRYGIVEDPYGYKWHISTHIENVTPAKVRKRIAEMFVNN